MDFEFFLVSIMFGLGLAMDAFSVSLANGLNEQTAFESVTINPAKLLGIDKQVGSIVTILVQNGTLRLGDPIVVGTSFGKVRTLKNDKGQNITEAGPSTPVEVTGISEVPSAGDKFMAFESEKQAKEMRKKSQKEKAVLPKVPIP